MTPRVAALLALVGCGGDAPGGGPDAEVPTPTPTATPTPDVTTATPTPTPAPTGDTAASEGTRLVLGPEVRCAEPGLRRTLGPLTAPTGGGAWASQVFDPDERTLFTGGGLTVADLDGDGRRDVVLTGVDRTRLLLQTGPLQFTDVSDTHLPDAASDATAAIPADLDADGDLDLLVTRYRRDDALWRNDGAGHMSPWPGADAVAGNGDPGHSVGGAFADLDGDDDLDLIVTVYGAMYGTDRQGYPSRLYENRGGTFVDVSDRLPEHAQTGYTFVSAFHDLDGDRLPELYMVNDHGQRVSNVLVWNRGGLWQADDGTTGLNVSLQGMGLSIDDLEGDGDVDFTMAGWFHHDMLVAHQGLWLDQSQQVGFTGDRYDDQHVAWGPTSGDLDCDGDLDLVMGFGMIHNQNTPVHQPDEVFLRNAGGTYDRVGDTWGFRHTGQTRGVLAVDVNGDGWLDLLRKDLIGPATLQTARCDERAWLEVSLVQPGGNRDAIGATVRVLDGGTTWTRWIRAGGTSVFSAEPPVAHVGLGDRDRVERLEITWPDGGLDVFTDVPTRRAVRVVRAPR